jgi:ArsR family transcriptional regulator
MGHMPKLVRPEDQPADVDAAISAFGNRARSTILRYLTSRGDRGALRADIAEDTHMAIPTLSKHLRALEDLGVVHGNIDPDHRRGRSVAYRANTQRIQQLLAAHQDYMLNTTED